MPDAWQGVASVSTRSGQQEVLVLCEPGLYFFLARLDKPKALPLQKWLAGEVLPSIRKTGAYYPKGNAAFLYGGKGALIEPVSAPAGLG